MMIKNNLLFQACILLASVLTLCTPVFSLDSFNDFGLFEAYFSAGEYEGYSVEACFGIGGASGSCLGANQGDYLIIKFPNPVNLTNFNYIPASIFDTFSVNGNSYPATEIDLLNSSSITLQNIETLAFLSSPSQWIWVDSISFDFEYADVVNSVSDNDITEGINWSLFAYSFTVVIFFAMLGRGIKSIMDLIKYG